MDTLHDAWLAMLGGQHSLAHTATVAWLLAARLVPLVWLAPWWRPPGAPPLAAWCIAAMLTVVLLPVAAIDAPVLLPDGVALVLSAMREVVVGGSFALLAALAMHALREAGHLAAIAGGTTHPTSSFDPLPRLYLWLGLAIFVAAGGVEHSLRAVASGLVAVPVGGTLDGMNLRAAVPPLVTLTTNAVLFGVMLAMPAMLGALFVDLTHAVSQRWLAPWPSAQLWPSLRHSAALICALLSLSVLASALPEAYQTTIDDASSWLQRLTQSR